jgi:putative nucleotidyltransferase with HDIG domain
LIGKLYKAFFDCEDIFVDDEGVVWRVSSSSDKSDSNEIKIFRRTNSLSIGSSFTKREKTSASSFFQGIDDHSTLHSMHSNTSFSILSEIDHFRVYKKAFEENTSGMAIFTVDMSREKIIPAAKNLAFEINRLARLPVIEGIPLDRPMSKADHLFLKALIRVARTGRQEALFLSEEGFYEEVLIKPLSDRDLISVHKEVSAEMNLRAELISARYLASTIDQAVISVDENERIVFVNKTAEILLGRERSNLIGKNIERHLFSINKSNGQSVLVEAAVKRIEDSSLAGKVTATVYCLSGLKFEDVIQESAQKTIRGLIETLSTVVEVRDPFTAGHQRRVSKLATAIATEMGLGPEQIDTVREGALLHDIGKISVPTEILSKPGRLTENEWFLIQSHSEAGFKMLERIDLPWPISSIVRKHHERLDGSGYPHGLKGKDIPFETRIVTVADVFEAIVSHRPYRPAHETSTAITELTEGAGRLYDGDVVDCCLSLVGKGFSLD